MFAGIDRVRGARPPRRWLARLAEPGHDLGHPLTGQPVEHADIVVIGGGSAGAAAAAFLAQGGREVVLLERAPLDKAGARWCTAVPGWCFSDARLARPREHELLGPEHETMHLIAGWGPERVIVTGQDVLEVDMRLLVARLQELAACGGADLRGGVAVTGVGPDGTVHTSSGELKASVVIDASGQSGVRRGTPRGDLCTAVQEVRENLDPAAARAWQEQHELGPHDIACFSGVSGGFSIVNVRISDDEVAVLTGTLPADGALPARTLQDRFISGLPFVGPVRFGGARAIPVRRPDTRLVNGAIVRLGDAAGQVYAAHGSGVGAHLVAARQLSDTLLEGGTLTDFDARWQRRWGGELAASDLFCRFSRSLGDGELSRLVAAGLLHPDLVRPSLEQREPHISPRLLAHIMRAAAREPMLAARLLPLIGQMAAARGAYRVRPDRPLRSERWPRLVQGITGRQADHRGLSDLER